ncbi:ABC transporter permease [Bacillus sp. 3255]|uniref:ABC transporter permease n=1 Tax=Bacillus sp. 3255 TaxID=2817904 RepID=UPI002861F6AA|nr:ABC transporter permease [Bacillus sp. 3255]MDR6878745.1 lipopolysaccharide transport system permease protein [Bacillus sp. 3255]
MFKNFWHHRELIKQFTVRDVISRYKGSYLGIFWSFLNPLLMLTVYTFVFSEIFKSKWNTGSGSKMEFALIIFAGLSVFSIFSEVTTRSPSLIVSNSNYVKKVVFPLEILPISILGSSIIHAMISIFILISGVFLFLGEFHWTIIYFPIVTIPLLLYATGLGWFLAAIGVYLRDIGQIVGIAVQALQMLSPIFYPVTSIPDYLKPFYAINPFTYIVEDIRNIFIFGMLPNWTGLGFNTLIGIVVLLIGYYCFQKLRGGFADVI